MKQRKILGKGMAAGLFCLAVMICIIYMPGWDITAYAAHRCPGCDDLIDGDDYCKECYQCSSCVDLCDYCKEVCSDCTDVYEIGGEICCESCLEEIEAVVDGNLDTQCEKCGAFIVEEGSDLTLEELEMLFPHKGLFVMESGVCEEHCLNCYEENKCNGCDNCLLCYEKCDDCDLCEGCREHCEKCGVCKESVGEDNYDSDNGLCMECAIEEGLYCPNCRQSADEVDICENCEICVECAVTDGIHCVICEVCGGEEDLCDINHDPMCEDCAISEEAHCPDCRECYGEVNRCRDDMNHCEASCLICDNCGLCFAENESDFCKDCQYCRNCGWEQDTICVDCEACLITKKQCATHADDPTCEECCRKYTATLGCTHDICCFDTDAWEAHIEDYHIEISLDGATLSVAYCDISKTMDVAPWRHYLGEISKLVIEDEVKVIPQSAFYDGNTKNLNTCIKKVVISGKVGTIPYYSFACLGGMEELELGSGIETIEKFAFFRSEALKEIKLPASIKRIDSYAFLTWNAVPGRTITFTGEAPEYISTTAFSGNGSIICYYPDGDKSYDKWIQTTFEKVTVSWVPVKINHDFATTWSSDKTNHWHECTECGERTDEAAHSGGKATCQVKAKCSTCGAEYGKLAAHKYATVWSTDGKYHWHACTGCGKKKDKAEHTLVTTTTRATTSANGKKETKCSVCDKVTSTKTIYAIKTVRLESDTFVYNGKVQKATVVVKDSKGNVISSDNYKLTYSDGLINVGKYTVKITFKGDYKGSKTLSYVINPKPTEITELTAGTKSFTATWKKQTTQVTGYEIEYSTTKSFENSKKVKVTKNTTVTKTVENLKAKQTYFVRVRTYKTVAEQDYCSDWSKAVKVTTK